MKQLIVTADDVGLHRGMTEGAIRAHTEGIVTACSIVANGAAFDHAVERLREVPALEVGVHLALVEERPIAADVASLVGPNGLMHESYVAFVPRYLARLIGMDEIERELRAQIEKVLAAGLRVTHLNGHQHLHLLPRIFAVVQRLAEEYRIGFVRVVRDMGGRAGFARRAAIGVLSRMKRTHRRTIGVASAGHLTAAEIITLLDHVEEGLTELVCHPGLGDEELQRAYDWGYEWEGETAALCAGEVRNAIQDRGITLTTPLRAAAPH